MYIYIYIYIYISKHIHNISFYLSIYLSIYHKLFREPQKTYNVSFLFLSFCKKLPTIKTLKSKPMQYFFDVSTRIYL